METGHTGIVWSGGTTGIITRVKIRGTLDLEWAEKELGIGGK